jgi:hypothetical protein
MASRPDDAEAGSGLNTSRGLEAPGREATAGIEPAMKVLQIATSD